MFNIECIATLKKVALLTKEQDGVCMRMCRLTVSREFDDLVAQALGGEAKKVMAGLKSGGIESVVIPIDAVVASLNLVCGDEAVGIARAAGVKATGKAPKESDWPPSIALEFEFFFDEPAWAFLGRNCGVQAKINIEDVQRELPLTTKKAS